MDESACALPEALLERLREILPAARLEEALESFEETPPVALRVNTLRTSPAELRERLRSAGLELEPVPWYAAAFVLRRGDLRELQATDAWRGGEVYVQGLASMTAALALAPRPGERVLDLTAAPGGKTCQIACLMEGRGEILANDRSRKRFFRLRANLEQQGVEMARLSRRRGETFGRTHPEAFDRVLLDAPCSGEARARAGDPDSLSDWKPKKIKRLAGEQQGLIISAVRGLRPGGVLVYSTCTFAPEENEAVVHRALRRFAGELALEEIDLDLPERSPGLLGWRGRDFDPSLSCALRILPGPDVQGFFLARLRKG